MSFCGGDGSTSLSRFSTFKERFKGFGYILSLEAAVQQAKTLESQWGRSEAWEVYQQMRLVWPGDLKIKSPSELFHL